MCALRAPDNLKRTQENRKIDNMTQTDQKKNIRILHLRSSGGFYGAESVILNLIRQLNGSCSEQHILCLNNTKNPHTELVNKAMEEGLLAGSVDCRGVFDRGAVRSIRAYIIDHKIDILHCHDYKATVFGLIASRGLKLGRVATNHLWDTIDWKLWLYERLEGMLYNFFDRVVCVSEPIAKTVRPFVFNRKKIRVIPNGISMEVFQDKSGRETKRGDWTVGRDDILIGIVGRLVPQKGHRIFLKAFKKVVDGSKNVKCVFIGDGPDRGVIENEIQRSGLSPFVQIAGEQKDMPAVYAALDMLVMPSLEEGLPMVLLEAMSAGLPVVATKVGAIPDVIKDGFNGLLVDPQNVEQLAEAIYRIIDGSGRGQSTVGGQPPDAPLSLSELTTNARQTVELHFSRQRMASEYLNIYKNL